MSEEEKINMIKNRYNLSDLEVEEWFCCYDDNSKSVQIDNLVNFIEIMKENEEEQKKINRIMKICFMMGIGLCLLLIFLYMKNY
ncbi:hypothetical protein MKA27_17400 [[Clostridium] innocuum]|uniref:hypothetical protein n=1 Tax=Clostridium innocuum TaxID=1522 RepID=UPI000D6D8BA5|nr:hypothetical protein [[Clostridium] innocuum]MCR0375588.1 hypothetical protein [[Clostridium] innocuum]PWJ12005.1 hypothetical protein ATF84_11532 [[Clostridium] innocuum]SSA47582.1 hypothetical protein SAMN04487929_11532 [[Clostridium] innocuum]